MTMFLGLLLACANPGAVADARAARTPSWTVEGAFAPHLARIDTDGDGKIVDGEWARVAYGAPALGNLDTDGDDALSVKELLAWLDTQDAVAFDGVHRSPPAEGGAAPLMGARARWAWEELTLRSESARARGLAAPTPAQVRAAVEEDAPDGTALREARALLDGETSDPDAAMRPPADAEIRAALDARIRGQLRWGPPREGTITPGSTPAATDASAPRQGSEP